MTTNSGRGARIGAVPQRTHVEYLGKQSWGMERHNAPDRCVSTHDRLGLVVRARTSDAISPFCS